MDTEKDILTIAVVGAGIMGRGIAQVAAIGGFQTVLNDVSDDLLQKALAKIQAELAKGVQIGKVRAEDARTILGRIKLETDLSRAASNADLVIEAAPEKIDIKLDLFARLDKICPGPTIFASNTSALSITEKASATKRPHQFIGMHFLQPVDKMKLVEIIRGLETNDETFEVAGTVSKQMGKETVEVKESPGFVTSRINALIGNEAFYM